MKSLMHSAFTVFLLMAMTAPERALPQSSQAASPPASASFQARAKDVDTIEHILSAVYESISGPPGPRNWDRFRSLFYPDARLIPSRRDASGKISANSVSVDGYITRSQPYFDKEGFYEVSVANRVEVWDHIAQVWSTYESRHAKAEKPFARGINSFQLLNDGSRWWVVTVYWEAEDAAHPIPEKYVK